MHLSGFMVERSAIEEFYKFVLRSSGSRSLRLFKAQDLDLEDEALVFGGDIL